jgi:membrane protein DedA with SNARE-associated domain
MELHEIPSHLSLLTSHVDRVYLAEALAGVKSHAVFIRFMNPLEQFLAHYGLTALVLLAAVEGDLSLIVAGALAHLGIFWLPTVILAGAGGTLLGDCAWFFLGRRLRTSVRESQLYRRVGPRIEGLAERLGVWQLLAARFIWGTRNASMFFWGQHGLPFGRFLMIDALGAVIGASLFTVAGYFVGQGAVALLGHIKRLEHWLLIILAGGIVVTWIISRLTRRTVQDSKGGI